MRQFPKWFTTTSPEGQTFLIERYEDFFYAGTPGQTWDRAYFEDDRGYGDDYLKDTQEITSTEAVLLTVTSRLGLVVECIQYQPWKEDGRLVPMYKEGAGALTVEQWRKFEVDRWEGEQQWPQTITPYTEGLVIVAYLSPKDEGAGLAYLVPASAVEQTHGEPRCAPARTS